MCVRATLSFMKRCKGYSATSSVIVTLGAAAFFGVAVSHAEARVFISEIAWMGTSANANAEWIELMNDGAEQDLTGWTLSAADGTPNIPLKGTISANSHFLLERSSDATVAEVPAGYVYTGALDNDGEVLTLYDSTGAVADTVDGTAWAIGGDNVAKTTPQRSGSLASGGWITAEPTPGCGNATMNIQSTTTEHTSSTTPSTSAGTQTSTSGGSTQRSGTSAATGGSGSRKPAVPLPPSLTIAAGSDRTTSVRVPVRFVADVRKEGGVVLPNADVRWSFGDGATARGERVTHTYKYPGTYVVVAHTEREFTHPPLEAEASVVVRVLPFAIAITEADTWSVTLMNNGDEDVDMTGFALVARSGTFRMPARTMLMRGASARFPVHVTKLAVAAHDALALYAADGALVAQYTPGTARGAQAALPAPQTVPATPPVRTLARAVASRAAPVQAAPAVGGLEPSSAAPVEPAALAGAAALGATMEPSTPLWWWLACLGGFTAVAASAVLLLRREERAEAERMEYSLEEDD